ncbi:MAG: hypothetical protein KF868_00400 [Acidobacteria bacterium]|nr:hypothetical protein [Acidobacteriota bacterium]MCW5969427.1 hypothetical protein [Blastocatellales bacterium]
MKVFNEVLKVLTITCMSIFSEIVPAKTVAAIGCLKILIPVIVSIFSHLMSTLGIRQAEKGFKDLGSGIF